MLQIEYMLCDGYALIYSTALAISSNNRLYKVEMSMAFYVFALKLASMRPFWCIQHGV